MALLDRITGFSKYEQELEPRLLSKTLESLRVRVDQSHKALWLVSATALVYMVMLWGETASVPLLVWFGLIVLLALVRVWISLYVARNIQSATVSMLYRNEIPLHAMTLFLGSLRHMAGDARARELIDKIDDTSCLLHEQFNSLLDLSKFDAGVVTADEVEFRLDTLLKNIVDDVSPEAHQKKLTIQLYSPAVTIRSDMLLIDRMIRNLIVNAVRYTDKGSVNVQVRRKRSGLVISIVDTGIGIATEDQQKIFRDYYQIRNRARPKGKGSGLGLAIVKRIAALLDFKVNLKSTPDTGSTFNIFVPACVLLDVSESGVEKQSGIEADSSALEGIHILVVDDDPVNLDAMTGLLRTWGCHAVGASTPEQVERLLAHDHSFDLVLMDDMLHDEISGFDIARNLEATLSPGRVIMVTGNVSAVRMFEIRDAGFELLTKPVDYYALRKALVDALAE